MLTVDVGAGEIGGQRYERRQPLGQFVQAALEVGRVFLGHQLWDLPAAGFALQNLAGVAFRYRRPSSGSRAGPVPGRAASWQGLPRPCRSGPLYLGV